MGLFSADLYDFGVMTLCFVGLGGNFEESFEALREAIRLLGSVEGIFELKWSRFYRTSPVSDVPQRDYFNAVARFECELSLEGLWAVLQGIERKLGKVAKEKNAPRLIDVDVLFYGSVHFESESLVVPHPRWKERLFVLRPLADVTETTPFGERLEVILEQFTNPHREVVVACS